MNRKKHCPNCNSLFDSNEHLPRVLQKCPHFLCSSCISELLKESKNKLICPIDSFTYDNIKNIDYFPPKKNESNRYLKKTAKLRKVLKKNSSKLFCNKHSLPLNIICIDDRIKICSQCVLNSKHSNHQIITDSEFIDNIDYLIDLFQEINSKQSKFFSSNINKISKAKKILEGIDIYFNELKSLIQKTETKLINNIKNQCEKIKTYLEDRKNELDTKYQITDLNMNNLHETSANWVKNVSQILDNLNSIKDFSTDYIKLLDENYYDLIKVGKQLKDRYNFAGESLSNINKLKKFKENGINIKVNENLYKNLIRENKEENINLFLVEENKELINKLHLTQSIFSNNNAKKNDSNNTECETQSLINLDEMNINNDSLLITPCVINTNQNIDEQKTQKDSSNELTRDKTYNIITKNIQGIITKKIEGIKSIKNKTGNKSVTKNSLEKSNKKQNNINTNNINNKYKIKEYNIPKLKNKNSINKYTFLSRSSQRNSVRPKVGPFFSNDSRSINSYKSLNTTENSGIIKIDNENKIKVNKNDSRQSLGFMKNRSKNKINEKIIHVQKRSIDCLTERSKIILKKPSDYLLNIQNSLLEDESIYNNSKTIHRNKDNLMSLTKTNKNYNSIAITLNNESINKICYNKFKTRQNSFCPDINSININEMQNIVGMQMKNPSPNFSRINMSGLGMQIVCSFLHKNRYNKYKEMKFLNSNLNDDDLFILVRTLLDHNISLFILNLSNNKISDESTEVILDLVKEHKTLKGLSLYNNCLSELLKEKLKKYTELGRENLDTIRLYV